MKNYIGRQKDLQTKLNRYLFNLSGLEKDYYNLLSPSELAELKTVLSDINNVFTLKLTLLSANWICDYFELMDEVRQAICNRIDSVKPNTNGFDILIDEPNCKVVAEVKCVFPSNNGDKYLAAQSNSILDDAYKLKSGKKPLYDTGKFIKFLFVIHVGERSDKAIDKLLKASKGTSDKDIRKNRHEIKKSIVLFKNHSTKELNYENIYLKMLAFE